MKILFRTVDETKRAVVEQALLAAAERVLSRKGYDAVTMSDIAQEAGCAKGSLYLYFETKEVLFDTLVNGHICKLMSLMTERMQAVDGAVEKLRAGNKALLEYFGEHRGFFRIFFSGRAGRGGFDLGLTGAGREAYERFKNHQLALMRQAQKEGRVRQDVPADELLAFLHDIAIATLARWTRSGGPVQGKPSDSLWQLTARGLGLPPEE